MIKSFGRFASILAVVAFSVGASVTLLASSPAGADPTTLVVNTTLDSGDLTADSITPSCAVDNVSTCTLREAISEASETSGDIVSIPTSGHYLVQNPDDELTVGGDGNDITITGAGQNSVFIDASCEGESCSPDIRVMKINTGAIATISGVTIEYGDPDSGIGGGILNCGTLTLNDSTVQNNVADDAGGGIDENQTATATLTDDIIQDNYTTSTVGPGNFEDFGGGGIYLDGDSGNPDGPPATPTLSIAGTTIAGNHTTADGGGIQIGGDDNIDTEVSISDSTISGNFLWSDGQDGGGISQDSLSTLTVDNSTISDNTGGQEAEVDDGGGVSLYADGDGGNATFNNDAISDNEAVEGAGIAMYDTNLTMTNSAITDNTASSDGGGLFIGTGTDADESIGNANISNSTISDNTAGTDVRETVTRPAVKSHTEVDDDEDEGGGIMSYECTTLVLTNDTVAANTVLGNDEGEGGGLEQDNCNLKSAPEVTTGPASHDRARANTVTGHLVSDATGVALQYDTFDANSGGADSDGANIEQDDSAPISLGQSIFADPNSGSADCWFADEGSNVTSSGYNLFDDDSCGVGSPATSDIAGQPAQLGDLGNDGSTVSAGNQDDSSNAIVRTELPGAGSPALNAIPKVECFSLFVSTDERGLARPGNAAGTCTIGAVEPQVTPPPPPPPPPPVTFNPNGYRMAADEGGVFDFGIQFGGALANAHLNAPIIGIANNPGPNGYLLVASDGGVFALGGANFFGSLGGDNLPAPISAIAATPDGGGYWLVGKTGTIYNFGDAPNLPAVTVPPGDHIVGIASTNDGQGAWLTDNAGDVYTEGDAQFLGSLGTKKLNAPIVGIAPAATGQGYILAASDGGAFAFGVTFHGSVPGVLKPGQVLNAPIVGIAVTHSGNGYWMVGADGGVFCFGDAPFLGSTYTQLAPGQHLNGPIVGIQHLGNAPA